jgi:hypothetical protein
VLVLDRLAPQDEYGDTTVAKTSSSKSTVVSASGA